MFKIIIFITFLILLLPNITYASSDVTITGDSGVWEIDASSSDLIVTKTGTITQSGFNVVPAGIMLIVLQQNPTENPLCEGINSGNGIRAVNDLGVFWTSDIPVTLNLGSLGYVALVLNGNPSWIYTTEGGDEYFCHVYQLIFKTDPNRNGFSFDIITHYFLEDGGRTQPIKPSTDDDGFNLGIEFNFLPGIIALFTIVSLLKLRRKNY